MSNIQHPMNSRIRALLIVLLVWAVVYLPALGSLAIKGEEGRRILPAIQMLKTGDYVVPQVGSNPYFRKPPLVNWLVAGSFKFFAARNEWTARLPSALAVLAVAIAFVIVARARLGPKGSMTAALIWLTNIGMIEKGRLIEIEGLYVSLCGLAIICWLSFWTQKKSAWLIWVPASIFLGLGMLAKRPARSRVFPAVAYPVAVSAVFKISASRSAPTCSCTGLGDCAALSCCKPRARRGCPLQHAVFGPGVVAAGDGLCRRRAALARPNAPREQGPVCQSSDNFRRTWARHWRNRLSAHRACSAGQAAGNKGRRYN